jgi:hypothetical protein
METVAALTNLQEAEIAHSCSVLDVNGHLMQVQLKKPIAVGSPVKVEADDTISLGEVSYCSPEGDNYIVWVALMESLHNVTELSRLARALVN